MVLDEKQFKLSTCNYGEKVHLLTEAARNNLIVNVFLTVAQAIIKNLYFLY